MRDTVNLKSFRIVATNIDDAGTTGLVRWYCGGKANRVTYHCEEGNVLMMSLDEALFKMPYYVDDDATDISPWYDADTAKQSLTLPTTEPYYFSYGAFKMKMAANTLTEESIPSIRNFRLDVSNNLEPKYYIMTNDEKVPYQIYEGKREYRLSFTVDLVDYSTGSFDKNDLFLELMKQGIDTTLKGSGVELTFTRGVNDTIRFRTPLDYTPTHGGDEQGGLIIRAPHNIGTDGIMSVPVEMICRDLEIQVVDSVAPGDYPI